MVSKSNLDLETIRRRTEYKTDIKMEAIKYAFNLLEDPKKAERKSACLCSICFYSGPTLAGCAITHSDCDSCSKNMVFASTHTDHFCQECAEEFDLCKDCGCQMSLQLGKLKQLEG